jgi:O-antigen biosynthesis protein
LPVHSNALLTERCLRGIAASSDGVPYEVIVVDDASDRATRLLLRSVRGARVLRNRRSLGYLKSTNRGAAEARGRHIVLLNNDTEPRAGWLAALVRRAESAADVGVVAAKLIYPDGALQEAGGIVWRNGEASNFGNRNVAHVPEYDYVREVDYGTAAALLVRADLWREVGGFDVRYAPAYYEDVDLCFAARERGRRVLYEPTAVVVHDEGGTMGTDVEAGAKRYQVINRTKFVERWSDALREQPEGPSQEAAYLASNRCGGPIALVVDHHVPAPDRDAGSLRMWALMESLLDLGWRVILVPDDREPLEPYGRRLKELGVEVLDVAVGLPERIAACGDRLRLAILSRPHVAARYVPMLRGLAPEALIAFDTVDLHHLRERRRLEHAGIEDTRVADAFEQLELAVARSTDVTLVVTEDERRYLGRVVPEVDVEIVPMANEIAADVPGPAGRAGLLFVGGFQHAPNGDAVEWLVEELMPLLWERLPEARLTVVGGNVPAELLELAEPRIEVRGWVEDIEPLLRESLALVAPLRYGAGVKGKITQSMAAGLPVVTTSVGAEGIGATDGQELLIADDADGIVERIAAVHGDPELWDRLSRAGRELAERTCSPRAQRQALERVLARLP